MTGGAAVSVADGLDRNAIGCEPLPRPVGGEHLDAQAEQVAREVGDPVAIGDREQGTHAVDLPRLRPR